VDFKTQEIVYSHEFDRMEKMPGMDIVYLPVVLSQILREELTALIDWLSEKSSG